MWVGNWGAFACAHVLVMNMHGPCSCVAFPMLVGSNGAQCYKRLASALRIQQYQCMNSQNKFAVSKRRGFGNPLAHPGTIEICWKLLKIETAIAIATYSNAGNVAMSGRRFCGDSRLFGVLAADFVIFCAGTWKCYTSLFQGAPEQLCFLMHSNI